MSRYAELVQKAIEELENNDELFIGCVDELDSWDGFADGFRAFEMCELDELCSGMTVSEFVEKMCNFDSRDDYFYFSIWGIETTDSKIDLYRENVEAGELLDNLIEDYSNIDIKWIDSDFDELISEIIEIIEKTER